MTKCINCGADTHRYGRSRNKQQRFHCLKCGKTFIAPWELGGNGLSDAKVKAVIDLLAQGQSLRQVERITGVSKDTAMRLRRKIQDGLPELQKSSDEART